MTYSPVFAYKFRSSNLCENFPYHVLQYTNGAQIWLKGLKPFSLFILITMILSKGAHQALSKAHSVW